MTFHSMVYPICLFAPCAWHVFHRIIRFARAKISGGIVRPICLAVLRLMTKLELRRLLDRQVGGLGAAQNFVDEEAAERLKVLGIDRHA